MDALEFVNEFARMCRQSSDNCSDCPLDKIGCRITIMDDVRRKNSVEEVEKWSKAHPKKTRQSEFLKMFPNASPLPGGALSCKPCVLDKNFITTRNCSYGCNNCRDDYWREEVE